MPLTVEEICQCAEMFGWHIWKEYHDRIYATQHCDGGTHTIQAGEITADGMLSALAWAGDHHMDYHIRRSHVDVWIRAAYGDRRTCHESFHTITDLPAAVVKAIKRAKEAQ